MRHRLSIACGAFQSLPRGGRWAGRKPGSDEGYLSQRIGCVLRQHRTTWNHPRDPSGEARHHEGQGASPGSALVHYGSLSAGSPHPSASRPPSPLGKALLKKHVRSVEQTCFFMLNLSPPPSSASSTSRSGNTPAAARCTAPSPRGSPGPRAGACRSTGRSRAGRSAGRQRTSRA